MQVGDQGQPLAVHRFHSWTPPLARAVVALVAVVVVGFALDALGVGPGAWVALVGSLLLLGVAAPLFMVSLIARRSSASDSEN